MYSESNFFYLIFVNLFQGIIFTESYKQKKKKLKIICDIDNWDWNVKQYVSQVLMDYKTHFQYMVMWKMKTSF